MTPQDKLNYETKAHEAIVNGKMAVLLLGMNWISILHALKKAIFIL